MAGEIKALKPMKGCQRKQIIERGEDVPLPCGLSFKVDGIRAMAYDNLPMGTSGMALRNIQIKKEFLFLGELIHGLDGELIDGNPNDKNVMQQAYTACMNTDAITNFTWWVFDDFSDPDLPFEKRYANYRARVAEVNQHLINHGRRPFLRALEYRNIENMEQYAAMQIEADQLGYEGLYGKSWTGKYKHGRATPKSRDVWKDKPWTDEEGLIIDFVEMMENNNEAFIDELGRTKRSKEAEGLVAKGYLGSFVVINPKYVDEKGEMIPFRVSAGSMPMAERKMLWENRENYRDKYLTYKFFNFGIVDVPRSALYKCFRDITDMEYF